MRLLEKARLFSAPDRIQPFRFRVLCERVGTKNIQPLKGKGATSGKFTRLAPIRGSVGNRGAGVGYL